MKVKQIDYSSTYKIRHLVLRKGKPIKTSKFDGDDFDTTKHFGLFDDDKIIGVVSVFLNKNVNFKEIIQYQIRGMAILEEYQNKNLGKLLIEEAEKYCKSKNATIIWFNAREKAVNFYKKFGYEINGNSFEIKEIGIHFLMFKSIT